MISRNSSRHLAGQQALHTLGRSNSTKFGTGICLYFIVLVIQYLFLSTEYRLRDCLTNIDIGDSGFAIDKHVAAIAHTCISSIADKGKSTLGIKAREHYALMMVSHYTDVI